MTESYQQQFGGGNAVQWATSSVAPVADVVTQVRSETTSYATDGDRFVERHEVLAGPLGEEEGYVEKREGHLGLPSDGVVEEIEDEREIDLLQPDVQAAGAIEGAGYAGKGSSATPGKEAGGAGFKEPEPSKVGTPEKPATKQSAGSAQKHGGNNKQGGNNGNNGISEKEANKLAETGPAATVAREASTGDASHKSTKQSGTSGSGEKHNSKSGSHGNHSSSSNNNNGISEKEANKLAETGPAATVAREHTGSDAHAHTTHGNGNNNNSSNKQTSSSASHAGNNKHTTSTSGNDTGISSKEADKLAATGPAATVAREHSSSTGDAHPHASHAGGNHGNNGTANNKHTASHAGTKHANADAGISEAEANKLAKTGPAATVAKEHNGEAHQHAQQHGRKGSGSSGAGGGDVAATGGAAAGVRKTSSSAAAGDVKTGPASHVAAEAKGSVPERAAREKDALNTSTTVPATTSTGEEEEVALKRKAGE
ncbi:hypothetical protein V492_01004, partial [Pseudogymnoascus sp. VKM F-4246]